MIKTERVTVLILLTVFPLTLYSYVILSVLPDDEKVSPTVKALVQFIESDVTLSRIVRIDRKGSGDYYVVYLPETREIQVLRKGQKFEVVASFAETDQTDRIAEIIYDLFLNRLGIPLRNVLSGDVVRFISPFVYSDAYSIKDRTERVLRDFLIDYNTGEVTIKWNIQSLTERDLLIYPVNTFAPGTSGPFSPVVASRIKVDYVPSLSRVYIKNLSRLTFHSYLFTEEGLYRFPEKLSGNFSTFYQINWRSKKVYLAISEMKIDFTDFSDFRVSLKSLVEAGKAIIYSFRFPEDKTFKVVLPPSVELLDYDYLNQRFVLRVADADFQKSSDEYALVINNEQEFVFNTTNISFSYLRPVREIQITKRRREGTITFESIPKILKVHNLPPSILLDKYEVRNGDFVNLTLCDIDGDEVKITGFESDSQGIHLFRNRIYFTNAPVGQRKLTVKISDGKSEVSREISVKVLNTPPIVNKFDVFLDNDCIVINYNVTDPDPQTFEAVVSVRNTTSGESLVKVGNFTEVRIKLLPVSGTFIVNLTVNDGVNQVSRETTIRYNSPYELGTKSFHFNVSKSKTSERIIYVERLTSSELANLKLVYTISESNTKPSTVWELINSEELFEIEFRDKDLAEIFANKSGYYHFGVIAKSDTGQVYFEKLPTVLVSQPPHLSIASAGGQGFEYIINVYVTEPDSDDYVIYAAIKDLDTGQTRIAMFDKQPKVLKLQFEKAGIYDVELHATDRFGVESKKEKVRIQVPSELPKFSFLSPNNILLKPSEEVVLRWELEQTKYILPVTYDVYIGESERNMVLYTSTNTNSTKVKISPGKTYYWKVVARFSKSLFLESHVCVFSVDREFLIYNGSLSFSANIQKIVQTPGKTSEFYVILSNGDLIRFKLDANEYWHEKVGNLYSTAGSFNLSGKYLMNISGRMFFIYDVERFSLVHWSDLRSDIIFGQVYNDTVVLCTSSQITLYNLKTKRTTSLQTPQLLSSFIEVFPVFDSDRQILIIPAVSNLLFLDIEEQKIVRKELIISRGSVFYCDLLSKDILLTIDTLGQVNSYRITDKSLELLSVSDVGISYPMRLIKLERSGIVFSNTGKIAVYRWNESGIVRTVLTEVKEDLKNLVAPSHNSIVYLTKNRLEYYRYDNISLLNLMQIKEFSTSPVDMIAVGDWIVIQDKSHLLLFKVMTN